MGVYWCYCEVDLMMGGFFFLGQCCVKCTGWRLVFCSSHFALRVLEYSFIGLSMRRYVQADVRAKGGSVVDVGINRIQDQGVSR